jgi:cellulose synthase/poly-beta-1,6-N-acetylglucosamine synthase-like glycosyltransferase
LLAGLALAYAAALAVLWFAWRSLPTSAAGQAHAEAPFVSILAPARNEANAIGPCLRALLSQQYPAHRMEILVIDDHSTDDTAAIAGAIPDPRIRVLSLAQHLAKAPAAVPLRAFKKAALSLGIAEARGELIVTTDADCLAPPQWLASLAGAYRQGAEFICAPVRISGPNNLLTAFQALDVAGVMVLTGGAAALGRPLLANGANLAFTPDLFRRVGGYAGHEREPSGDDVLLLHKVTAARAGRVAFLPQAAAVVATAATPTWAGLWRQRLRWAGKTAAYSNWRLTAFQGGAYLLSLALLLGWAFAPAATAAAWALKLVADGLYLRAAARALGSAPYLRWYLLAAPLHVVYLAAIGSAALMGFKAPWKGRSTTPP